MRDKRYNEDELVVYEGWHEDEKVVYVGHDTVTAPDGNEYPIKDRD